MVARGLGGVCDEIHVGVESRKCKTKGVEEFCG
jgi:hypothetical protein